MLVGTHGTKPVGLLGGEVGHDKHTFHILKKEVAEPKESQKIEQRTVAMKNYSKGEREESRC